MKNYIEIRDYLRKKGYYESRSLTDKSIRYFSTIPNSESITRIIIIYKGYDDRFLIVDKIIRTEETSIIYDDLSFKRLKLSLETEWTKLNLDIENIKKEVK